MVGFGRRPRILYLLASLLIPFISSESTCGSLVTYRQYSVLLDNAPSCFRNGCGGNDTASSMSSTCPGSAPCSQLWDLLQGQYQQDWCENCKNDVACRIPGWPVLNATAVCDISPHTWLFGAQGNCCSSGNDPFELAKWIGSFCNGSDWRTFFSKYGWMAEQDWAEYILPWNYTVAPQGVNSHNQQLVPECSKTPWYLGVFFLENMFFLSCAILFGVVRLRWIKLKENNRDPIQRLFWWRKNSRKEHNHPGILTQSFLGAYLPIMVGVFLAGIQIGFAMASARIIRNHEGYGQTNVSHLGLLFCSRPRLTWLACVLGLFRRSLPRRYFKMRHSRTAAKAVLAGVAVSSTVSEGIMQIVGIYYMSITADSGRHKGFYAPNHLTPYWKGRDAMIMYAGALMWLIACFPILLIWPLLAMYHAKIFFLLRNARIGLFRLLHLGNHDEPIYHAPNDSDNSFNEERELLFWPDQRDFNQAVHNGDGFNQMGGPRDLDMQEEAYHPPRTGYYGNSLELQPTNMQEEGISRIRGGGSSTSQSDMMQEPGDYAEAPRPRSGLRGGDGRATVRTRRGYEGLQRPSGASDTYHSQYGSRDPSRELGLRGGGASFLSSRLPERTQWDYEHWQAPIIWLGISIGLISYIAQWLFWSGFVKASGERYFSRWFHLLLLD
jgi:hypothetical protein